MAHSKATQRAVRNSYVYEMLSLAVISAQWGIAERTLKNWRRRAAGTSDDWDAHRDAHQATNMSDGVDKTKALITMQLFIDEFHASMEAIKKDAEISSIERVKALASLSDAFQKSVTAFRRVLPESDRLSIALDTIALLADFLREKHPERVEFFANVLSEFGAWLRTKFAA